jgi:hypothetical protein
MNFFTNFDIFEFVFSSSHVSERRIVASCSSRVPSGLWHREMMWFWGPSCLHIHQSRDEGSVVLQNVGILPHHYTVSQNRRWRQYVPPNFGILPHHYTVTQPRRWRQYVPPKRWYPNTSLHGDITQKMEAVCSSKTLVSYYNTARCHNSEDSNLNLHHRENLKTRKLNLMFFRNIFHRILFSLVSFKVLYLFTCFTHHPICTHYILAVFLTSLMKH